ncbi:MAG: hypothetical protein ACSHX0_08490 [Akkermansiaceae bacterium]
MKSFRKLAFLFVGIIAIPIVWLIFSDSPSETSSATKVIKEQTPAEKRQNTTLMNAQVSRSLRFDQDQAKLVNDPTDRSKLSEMALTLDDPTIDEQAAMDAVYSLLHSLSVTTYRGKFPAGLNVEITNALLGKNVKKVGVLPMDSPRINENGELVDMNNEPYWFHTSPSGKLTITSSGADKIMHTEDDVSFPSS